MRILRVFSLAALGVAFILASASTALAQAKPLTNEELIALIDHARTSSDHERLAGFYDRLAMEFDRKVMKAHAAAAAYRTRSVPIFPKIVPPTSFADYHSARALSARRSAKEAALLAEHHRMLARVGVTPLLR